MQQSINLDPIITNEIKHRSTFHKIYTNQTSHFVLGTFKAQVFNIKSYLSSNNTKDEYLYLCYGTLDAWTLVMAGYAGVTGISGQELNFHNLDRFRKPMYIIPDRGEEKNALALQTKLDWRGMLLLLEYPPDTKYLNGIQMKYGLEKVNEIIEKAKRRYEYD